ncbi:MAG: gliding motility-associated C-terminal domain-containing protein [Bacteroidia bacterium]|nr:gliding motility-associated C-terminal domain-containing protein [Bacteroidia bacterium]
MPRFSFDRIISACIFMLLLGISPLSAQNLVPNSSFNDFTWCPGGRGLLGWAVPWYSPNRNTSDFCHSCSGSPSYSGVPTNRWGDQLPYMGEGYAGIRTWISTDVFVAGKNYREYLAVELTDSLRGGDTYFLSFKVSVGDNAGYFSDDIGMYLSPDTIASDTILLFTPQLENPEGNLLEDMDNWVEISGQFVAEGGERFLVIGNFKVDDNTTLVPTPDSDSMFQTTYFFIDDVKVEACKARFPETLLFAEDSLICPGETIRLTGVDLDSATYEWEDSSTDLIRQIQAPGTYELSVSLNGCTRKDSISIEGIELPAIDLGADTTLCPGESLLLSVESGADSYLWSDQSNGTELLVESGGSYSVEVQKGKCSQTASVQISYEEIPPQPADKELQKCSDTDLELIPDLKGLNYTWQDFSTTENFLAKEAGTYWVEVESYCYQLRETFVVSEFTCSCESMVPNVFSPNGDGINEAFLPIFEAAPSRYQLDVFDRYGRALYSSTVPSTGWEGKLGTKDLPSGVYYWTISYSCLEGGEIQDVVKSGYLSLLR